jgi:hypothetical protein
MNISQISATESLIAVSFISALVFMVIAAISKKALHRKIFGSLLIFCLAALADSKFVYALAVLLIATLITDTEFIENIAAIVFRRKEFWAFRKATVEEIRHKQLQEVEELTRAHKTLAGQLQEDPNVLLRQVQYFEDRALLGLVQSGLFESVDSKIAVASGPDVFVADGVAKRAGCEFLVEVRCGKNSLALNAAALALQNFLDAYRAMHPNRKVRGVIVMPQDLRFVGAQEYLGRDIGLLRYDAGARKFVNQDEFAAWMGSEA